MLLLRNFLSVLVDFLFLPWIISEQRLQGLGIYHWYHVERLQPNSSALVISRNGQGIKGVYKQSLVLISIYHQLSR